MIEHAHVIQAVNEYFAQISTGKYQGTKFRILNGLELKKQYQDPIGREITVAFIPCDSFCVYVSEEKANSPTGVSEQKYGKVQLLFKTPDVVNYACDKEIEYHGAEASEEKCDKIKEVAKQFIQYGENIRIEFDLDEGTAKVLKVGE